MRSLVAEVRAGRRLARGSNDRGRCHRARLEALHAGGVRGVRFNFVRHLAAAPDARVFERTLAMIEPLAWHVVAALRRRRHRRFMQKCS